MRIEYSKGERNSKELIPLHRQTSEATIAGRAGHKIDGETLRVLLRPGRSACGPCRDGEVEEVAIQAGQITTVGGAPGHRITEQLAHPCEFFPATFPAVIPYSQVEQL